MWRVWTLTLLLVGTMGCAAVVLPPPTSENMSLVVGRFIIENPNEEIFFGKKLIKEGIELFIGGPESRKFITDKQGQFYIPNLSPGRYFLSRFKYSQLLFTDRSGLRKSRLRVEGKIQTGRRLNALPQSSFNVPANSVLFVGTYVLTAGTDTRYILEDVKYGRKRLQMSYSRIRFKPEFQAAKTDFLKTYGQTHGRRSP